MTHFWSDCLECGRRPSQCTCRTYRRFPEEPLTGFEWFCIALLVVAVVAFAVLAA